LNSVNSPINVVMVSACGVVFPLGWNLAPLRELVLVESTEFNAF